MEIYTATLIVKKHLEQQNDKRNLPKVNEEKLKEATELLTGLVKKLTIPAVVGRSEQLPKRLSNEAYKKAKSLRYEEFVEWWDNGCRYNFGSLWTNKISADELQRLLGCVVGNLNKKKL